jgi:hypothetical protein
MITDATTGKDMAPLRNMPSFKYMLDNGVDNGTLKDYSLEHIIILHWRTRGTTKRLQICIDAQLGHINLQKLNTWDYKTVLRDGDVSLRPVTDNKYAARQAMLWLDFKDMRAVIDLEELLSYTRLM